VSMKMNAKRQFLCYRVFIYIRVFIVLDFFKFFFGFDVSKLNVLNHLINQTVINNI
jgi:hypothetical protein